MYKNFKITTCRCGKTQFLCRDRKKFLQLIKFKRNFVGNLDQPGIYLTKIVMKEIHVITLKILIKDKDDKDFAPILDDCLPNQTLSKEGKLKLFLNTLPNLLQNFLVQDISPNCSPCMDFINEHFILQDINDTMIDRYIFIMKSSVAFGKSKNENCLTC